MPGPSHFSQKNDRDPLASYAITKRRKRTHHPQRFRGSACCSSVPRCSADPCGAASLSIYQTLHNGSHFRDAAASVYSFIPPTTHPSEKPLLLWGFPYFKADLESKPLSNSPTKASWQVPPKAGSLRGLRSKRYGESGGPAAADHLFCPAPSLSVKGRSTVRGRSRRF